MCVCVLIYRLMSEININVFIHSFIHSFKEVSYDKDVGRGKVMLVIGLLPFVKTFDVRDACLVETLTFAAAPVVWRTNRRRHHDNASQIVKISTDDARGT